MKIFRQTTSLLLVVVMLAGMVPAAWAEEPADISGPESELTGSPEEQIIEAEPITDPDTEPEQNIVPGSDTETGTESAPDAEQETFTEPETDADQEDEAEPEVDEEPEPALYELSAEERSMILSRDDGVWLFPVDKEYYGDIADFCGCRGEEPCLFCGEVHYNCADPEHINSEYGHVGLDIAVPEGTDVMAPAGGILYWTDYEFDGPGYTAVIEHTYENGWAYYTVFEHLQSVFLPSGSEVNAGDVFAYSGKSGSIDEWPHLHFAMFMAAECCGEAFASDPVNELAYVETQGWLSEYQGCGMIVNNPSPWSEAAPQPGDEAIQPELDKHPGTVKYTFDRTETTIAPYIEKTQAPVTVPAPEEEQQTGAPQAAAGNIVASGDCGSGWGGFLDDCVKYTLDDEGTLRIYGTGWMYGDRDNTSPPFRAFSKDIRKIIIEDGVLSIGYLAFQGCINLESIFIPSSVTKIKESAFSGCTALDSVYISDLESWCKIQYYYTDYGVPYYGDNPLKHAKNFYVDGQLIKDFYIPENITAISECAFDGADFTSVHIPASMKTIGADSFSGHIGNLYYEGDMASWCSMANGSVDDTFTGGSSRILDDLDNFYIGGRPVSADIVIPEGVADIADYAFCGYKAMKSVKLPGDLKSIGVGAFAATPLTSVELPDGLKTIGTDAFGGIRITEIVVPDSVTTIGSGAFDSCEMLRSAIIGNSVSSIGTFAFDCCRNLRSLTIGSSVAYIGGLAFRFCEELEEVHISDLPAWCKIRFDAWESNPLLNSKAKLYLNGRLIENLVVPDGVTEIKAMAFEGAKFDSVTFPESVTSIGGSAFRNCRDLKKVVIPRSLTGIDKYAFDSCEKLEDVYYRGSKSEWKRISIYQDGNYWLTGARIHFNYVDGSSTGAIDLKNFSVIIKGNTRHAKSEFENFSFLKNAQVFIKDKVYTTDENGQKTLDFSDLDGKTVRFGALGYATREINLERLKKDNTVYLQKESDYPVINALWYEDMDILHNKMYAEPLTDGIYVLTPEVYWGEGNTGTLKLYQEGREMELVDGINEVILDKKFDILEDIYLVATNSDGLTTRKVFSFKNANETVLEGYSLDLGDDLKLTLGDNAGILKGTKIKIGLHTPLHLSVLNEGGKVYITAGLRLDEKQKLHEEEKVKTFVGSLKEMKDSFKNAKNAEEYRRINNSLRKLADKNGAWCKGNLVFEGGCALMAYWEGYLDSNNKFHETSNWGVISFNFKSTFEKPFLIGPVPMFYEIEFTGDLVNQFNRMLDPEVKQFTPDIEVEFDIALKGGIGIGIAKAASFSGGLKGKLENTLNLKDKNVDYFRMYGSLSWYAKLKILFFKAETGKKIAGRTIAEYPDPADAMSLSAADEDDTGTFRDMLCDVSNFRKEDLSYLTAGSGFMGRNINDGPVCFAEPGTDVSQPFVSNAYEGAAPQIALFDDGTALAVWVGYNPDYTDCDALNVYYSYFNTTWSTPQAVEADGTPDNAPCLKAIGETAYLVWQDADSSLAGLDLAGTASHMGISAAVFDRASGTFGEAVPLIGGGVLNMTPTLCGSGDAVYAVWLQNSQNDWFGQNSANSIMSSTFDGSSWSAPAALYSGLNPVINIAADGSSGLSVAYTLDTDGDLGTVDDLEIYRDGTAVTSNDYADSGVCFGSGNLYWYSGGVLVCNGEPCMAEDAYITSDRFQIVNGAILYTEEDGLSSVLKIAYANGSGWGSPMVLSHDPSASIPFYCAASAPDGQLRILMEKQAIVGDYDSEEPYGEANLWWYNAPQASCNLRLDEVRYNNSNYVQGKEMPIWFTVSNTAELGIDSMKVEFIDAGGVVVHSTVINDGPLSGQTREYMAAYPVTEIVPGTKLTLRVTADDMAETDLTDNSKEITLGWNDIAVENARWGTDAGDMTVIHANIVNRGYEVQKDIVVNLREDRPDGNILQTKTVESLEPMTLQNVSFTVESLPEKVYYVSVEHKDTDDFYGNDNAFVYAKYSPDSEYYITYNANGGMNAPEPQMKLSGETLIITSEVPEREGFSFLGWAENSVDTAVKYKPGDEYTADKDVTLYAVWEKSGFTVSYDANGGINAPGPQLKKSGETLIITSEVPEREGFSFLGWAENSADIAAKYRPGDEYAADEDVTLYAVWKEYIPEADLNSDGVSDVMDAVVLMKDLVEETPGTDADLNNDGITDIMDLIALMKKISQ